MTTSNRASRRQAQRSSSVPLSPLPLEGRDIRIDHLKYAINPDYQDTMNRQMAEAMMGTMTPDANGKKGGLVWVGWVHEADKSCCQLDPANAG